MATLHTFPVPACAKNLQDGKHYVLSCKASETYEDKSSEGFNFAARMSFATLEDMNFYQDKCSAHQALKTVVIPLVAGRMTVYWEE